MAFKKASAPFKPTLFCTGKVDSFKQGKMSNKGIYVCQNVKIEGLGASTSAYPNLLYKIDWFNPSFNETSFDVPKDHPEYQALNSQKFVYGKSIISSRRGQLSILQGICGDEKTFDEVAAELQALPQPKSEAETETFITAVTKILETLVNTEIGYVLAQVSEHQVDAAGNKLYDSEGKAVRVLVDQYEISEFFAPTKENLKNYRKRAGAANLKKEGSVLVSFDGE